MAGAKCDLKERQRVVIPTFAKAARCSRDVPQINTFPGHPLSTTVFDEAQGDVGLWLNQRIAEGGDAVWADIGCVKRRFAQR
jgi:hypothetical protein